MRTRRSFLTSSAALLAVPAIIGRAEAALSLLGAGSGIDAAVATFRSNANDGSNLTTYTLADQAIGPAFSDRYVIVAITAGGTTAIASVTIGGIAASAIGVAGDGTHLLSALWIALVPTGTTATVVVNVGSGWSRIGIACYSVTGLQSITPYDTGSDLSMSSGVMDDVIDVPDGGFVIGIAYNGQACTFTWTGLTEDADFAAETSRSCSMASKSNFSGGAVNFAVSATQSLLGAGSFPSFFMASLR